MVIEMELNRSLIPKRREFVEIGTWPLSTCRCVSCPSHHLAFGFSKVQGTSFHHPTALNTSTPFEMEIRADQIPASHCVSNFKMALTVPKSAQKEYPTSDISRATETGSGTVGFLHRDKEILANRDLEGRKSSAFC
jgi:hypothetical protein